MSGQNLNILFKDQFIGMVDMNGKPIHEGDSVQFYSISASEFSKIEDQKKQK